MRLAAEALWLAVGLFLLALIMWLTVDLFRESRDAWMWSRSMRALMLVSCCLNVAFVAAVVLAVATAGKL